MNLTQFKEIPAGKIFRVVTTRYHNLGPENDISFVCKKGGGYDDWAIYYHRPDHSVEWIATNGEKLVTEESIRSIFPCSDEVFNLYRY